MLKRIGVILTYKDELEEQKKKIDELLSELTTIEDSLRYRANRKFIPLQHKETITGNEYHKEFNKITIKTDGLLNEARKRLRIQHYNREYYENVRKRMSKIDNTSNKHKKKLLAKIEPYIVRPVIVGIQQNKHIVEI